MPPPYRLSRCGRALPATPIPTVSSRKCQRRPHCWLCGWLRLPFLKVCRARSPARSTREYPAESLVQYLPFLQGKQGRLDIPGDGELPGHESEEVALLRFHRNHLDHRGAPLGYYDGFSCRLHMIHHPQTTRLERTCSHLLHHRLLVPMVILT